MAGTDYALGIQNNNMWFNTDSGFLWDIAGTTEMSMNGSGIVGIGTANPISSVTSGLDVYITFRRGYSGRLQLK